MIAGIHYGVPAAEYHRRELGVATKSGLDQVARSPAHYRVWATSHDRDETSPALELGTAVHLAVLEPERFAATYAIEPEFGDCRYKAAKEARAAWRAEHEGASILASDVAAQIESMATSVRGHALAGRLLSGGAAEVTAAWADPETELRCQCRADYYLADRRVLVDLKTAQDASPDGFRRSIASYRYHVQAAMYLQGFAAAGAEIEHFLFVAIEKLPPYAVGVYALDATALATGHALMRRDLATLAECVRRDQWPAYSASIETLSLPPWAAKDLP